MSVEQMSDRSDLMLSDGRGTFQVSYHESIFFWEEVSYIRRKSVRSSSRSLDNTGYWTYGTVTTIHNFDHSPNFLQSGIKG